MILAFRSLLFNLAFLFWTVSWGTLCLPMLLLPPPYVAKVARVWVKVMFVLLRWIVGLGMEVKGRENLPAGSFILASKHQSAWETMAFFAIFHHPAVVLKRELLRIPFFGWHLGRSGQIPIDRGGRLQTLKKMTDAAQAICEQGRPVVVFPEGTRVRPDETRRYHPGVYAIYEACGVPAVPVALNSGCFWGKGAFLKYPGTVTIAFEPPIAPGLAREAFMDQLKERIEPATAALVSQAAQERAKYGYPLAEAPAG